MALALSFYGVDQYILQYRQRTRPAVEGNAEKWMLSYPLLQRRQAIKTPTLFMGGRRTSTCR